MYIPSDGSDENRLPRTAPPSINTVTTNIATKRDRRRGQSESARDLGAIKPPGQTRANGVVPAPDPLLLPGRGALPVGHHSKCTITAHPLTVRGV